MPTYEYRCRSCGFEFEKFQKITEPPVGDCPNCGESVERLISRGGGLLFKGSGFYATDYRSGPKESGSEAGTGSEGKKANSKTSGDTGGDSGDTE